MVTARPLAALHITRLQSLYQILAMETSGVNKYNAGEYENTLFYEKGEHTEWMLGAITSLLKPRSTPPVLCDIGAGSGHFTHDLVETLGINPVDVTVVEPQEEFLPIIRKRNFNPVQADAVAYGRVAPKEHFDLVILKEMFHFIELADRPEFTKNIRESLKEGGESVAVCRPGVTELPFFEAAKDSYTRSTADTQVFVDAYKAGGFSDVVVHQKAFECIVPKAKWLYMLSVRFWSNLFEFSDEELQAGIAEVNHKYEGSDTIEFNDIINFIVARK